MAEQEELKLFDDWDAWYIDSENKRKREQNLGERVEKLEKEVEDLKTALRLAKKDYGTVAYDGEIPYDPPRFDINHYNTYIRDRDD